MFCHYERFIALRFYFKIKKAMVLIAIVFLFNLDCRKQVNYNLIPSSYVYHIIERNDSIYYSTQRGQLYSFHINNPDSLVSIGLKRFQPIRSFGFKKSGEMIVSSYETGIHFVNKDTLIPYQKMYQKAWAMKIDDNDNIWLAGRRGVYRQRGDTLIRFSELPEAYDVDFYNSKLVVAHRKGVTFFDTTTGNVELSLFSDTVCWTLEVFDTILFVGGVNMCALIKNKQIKIFRLPYKHNIPWSASMDKIGNIYVGSQYGLLLLKENRHKLKCIGFKKKCIKSVFVDSKGRLWVGRYFKF